MTRNPRWPATPASARLPVPDWGRAGETWRVEPVGDYIVPTDGEGVCEMCEPGHSPDLRPAVAIIRDRHRICEKHLTEGRMWIEDGQVVSWALRP